QPERTHAGQDQTPVLLPPDRRPAHPGWSGPHPLARPVGDRQVSLPPCPGAREVGFQSALDRRHPPATRWTTTLNPCGCGTDGYPSAYRLGDAARILHASSEIPNPSSDSAGQDWVTCLECVIGPISLTRCE